MPRGCNLVHWIPGRMRFTHPELGQSETRRELTAFFAALPRTRTLRVNARAKSIAVTYEHEREHADRADKRSHGETVLSRAFAALEVVAAVIDVPVLSYAFELLEAFRIARATWRVMRRRHRGASAPGVLAFFALLALRTSLLDLVLPRFVRKIAGAVRAVFAQRAMLTAFA